MTGRALRTTGFVAILLLPAAAAAQLWLPLGPAPISEVEFTGRVAALAASPDRPGLYYAAGASGGVWKTATGGLWWRPLGDDLPTLALGSVAIDPLAPRTIYAGSGEGHNAYHSHYGLGLYKSTNGGRHWQVLAPETFSGRTISRILVSPTDPGEVWVTVTPAGGSFGNFEAAKEHPDRAGPNGLFHSTDGGATWTQVGSLPATPASDVDLDPVDPMRMYVCLSDPYGNVGNGVYRSDDGGASFVRTLNNGPFGRTELAISPSNPDRVYALVARARVTFFNWGGFLPFGDSTQALFRSDDGGNTWLAFFPGNVHGGQGSYNAAVAVHPTDPEVVFLGGMTMLRSTDGGVSYTDVTPPHVDVHDITFDAAGRLLAATDGGVYRSTDLGDTWEPRNRNLGVVQFYPGISVDPTDRRRLLGGTQDNGSVLRTGFFEGWTMVSGGDGGFTAISPVDPAIQFVEFQGTGNLFRSNDGGLSFVQVNAGIDLVFDVTAFQAPFQIDPSNPERMLYATQRVYESLDLGDTWTPLSDDLTAGDPFNDIYAVRSLAIAPSNSQTVYATTNNQRLLVSTDGGATWELRREDVFGTPRVARQIAVDPADDARAYVAVGSFGSERVLATADRGQTWTSIGGGLPDLPVNTVAVRRAQGRVTIFAGTDRGVWSTTDGGTTWRRYGRWLPNAPVTDLVVDTSHRRLVAATLGRGVWWTWLRR